MEAYRKHVAERAALGVVPKPLDATQTAAVVDLLKNFPGLQVDPGSGIEQVIAKGPDKVPAKIVRGHNETVFHRATRGVLERFLQFRALTGHHACDGASQVLMAWRQ